MNKIELLLEERHKLFGDLVRASVLKDDHLLKPLKQKMKIVNEKIENEKENLDE